MPLVGLEEQLEPLRLQHVGHHLNVGLVAREVERDLAAVLARHVRVDEQGVHAHPPGPDTKCKHASASASEGTRGEHWSGERKQ
jgi:hypothetical protein